MTKRPREIEAMDGNLKSVLSQREILHDLPLLVATSPEWVKIATSDLGSLLVDHAWCEYKAATMGFGMIARYSDRPSLIRPMLALAQEEMLHFRQCLDRIEQLGISLGVAPEDRYVQALRSRFAAEGRGLGALGDTLMVNAFVEARSCERFRWLALYLHGEPGVEGELGEFYSRLAEAEARHWETFRELAIEELGDRERVERRIEEVAQMEAEIVGELPLGPRMH